MVIQHLDPKHESLSSEILSRATAMPVVEARQGMRVEPNHVYMIPPNRDLGFSNGILHVSPRSSASKIHLPINFFFESLAADLKARAIGVVLSGTASDGTQGLLAIKTEGGIALAQDPKTAKYPGMPLSAISSGAVDLVLSPEGIADELSRIAHHPYLTAQSSLPMAARGTAPAGKTPPETALTKIFAILCNRLQVDFAQYKRPTVLRRLARRLLLLKMDDVADYANYLEQHPEECKALFSEILIHVTRFFRDGEAFRYLESHILPSCLSDREAGIPFRVWVPGCSTGEEAYSIAIIILEYLDKTSTNMPVQIFASDISENAIQKARTGFYPGDLPEVSEVRKRKFFEKVEGGYRVNKRVRDACVFSKHDVTSDPPFAKVDLISCRNLLIYFSEELQKLVLPIFHYSLKPGGILFLGHSENIGSYSSLFSVLEKEHRFFQRENVSTPLKSRMAPIRTSPERLEINTMPYPPRSHHDDDLQKELDRIYLKEFAPPSIVINDSLDILQVRGRMTPYLEFTTGQASLNLLKVVRPELAANLRQLIFEARSKDLPVKKEGLRVLGADGISAINVSVTPLKLATKAKSRKFAIFFEAVASSNLKEKARKGTRKTTASKGGKKLSAQDRQYIELQHLAETQKYQRSLVAQYEAAQEQLTAANEELQSANEELQSTNEEMETAREELQSSNEELTTVNDELNTRNMEMVQLTGDLVNFVASAEIPIVMVGLNGHIRRFTPQAGKLLKLIPTDVGRPIGDIKPDIGVFNLDEIVGQVMKTTVVKEIETRDSSGIWYRLNVRPYRTSEGKVEGAVIALIDIDALKRSAESLKLASEELKTARDDALTIIKANPIPLLVISSDGRVTLANQAFYDTFQATPESTNGLTLSELEDGMWNIPQLISLVNKTLDEGAEFNGFEIEHHFPHIGLKFLTLNARRVPLAGSGNKTALLAIEDSTAKRLGEQNLRNSEEKYRNLVASAYDGIMVVRPDGTIEVANRQLEATFGYEPGELVNKSYEILIVERDRAKHVGLHKQYMTKPEQREMGKGLNLVGRRKDGVEFPIDVSLSPFRLKSDVYVNCVVRDISKFKEIENERLRFSLVEKKAREQAENANRIKDEFLAILSHELRTPLTTILSWAQLLRSGKLDAEKTKHGISVLEQSAKAQGQLINDLLDISRIQAGKLKLDIQEVEPGRVVSAAIESTRELANSKSMQVEVHLDPEVKTIAADPVRLQQILWNLISNAVKFSPAGGKIWINLSKLSSPDGNRIQFQVRDNGKGVKPEFIPVMFDRFTQVDSTSTRSYGGLGLGLAIVKKLVEMHGGTVEVESPGEGKGTLFTIKLPIRKLAITSAPEAKTEAEKNVSLAGLRVLLVDDEASAREVLAVTLSTFGAEVTTAQSVADALSKIQEVNPHVLVSDIGMPVEDGYGLIGKVRALQTKLSQVPALALTAFAGREDILRAKQAGFQSHLAKPVDANKLAVAIARLAERK